MAARSSRPALYLYIGKQQQCGVRLFLFESPYMGRTLDCHDLSNARGSAHCHVDLRQDCGQDGDSTRPEWHNNNNNILLCLDVWIVAALFLIATTLVLRLEIQSEWLNVLFFPKLTDSWQYVFYSEIPYTSILVKNTALLLYTLFVAVLGIRIFEKRDIT